MTKQMKTKLQELQEGDYRCYVTAQGFNAEATAHALNQSVNITHIQIGRGQLPSDQSPISLVNMVDSYGLEGRFACSVTTDIKNPGGFIAQIVIPAEHAINGSGYEINEAACLLDSGLVYAYRRVPTDYKLVTEGESKSYIIRMRFRPSNADIISFTIDPAVVLATHQDVADEFTKHQEETDPHKQYVKKKEAQFLPYDSSRTYKTGEICTIEDDGNVIAMQMYAGPKMTCNGKDPAAPENRHVGWQDPTAPFYWIEYKGDITGMPFFWLDTDAPEWAVMEINVNLPVVVYWRLARRYPHLARNGFINTGEIRGEFIRVLDQGRGVDSNRQMSTYQPGTKIVGDTGHVDSHGITIYNINSVCADPIYEKSETFETRMQYTVTTQFIDDGIPFFRTVRPRNVARAMAIAI